MADSNGSPDTLQIIDIVDPDTTETFATSHGNIRIALTATPGAPIVLLTFSSIDAPTASILPTAPPTPASAEVWDPTKWETGEWDEKKILDGKVGVLWVGAIGNMGLKPGTYEYRDNNGGEVVARDGCYLMVNRGDPKQRRISADAGQTFSYQLRPHHQNVSFGGFKGSRCSGGLYQMGG